MLMRNWSKKILFRQLVVMEDNQSELITSNQQNQNQNSGQYDSCNIAAASEFLQKEKQRKQHQF